MWPESFCSLEPVFLSNGCTSFPYQKPRVYMSTDTGLSRCSLDPPLFLQESQDSSSAKAARASVLLFVKMIAIVILQGWQWREMAHHWGEGMLDSQLINACPQDSPSRRSFPNCYCHHDGSTKCCSLSLSILKVEQDSFLHFPLHGWRSDKKLSQDSTSCPEITNISTAMNWICNCKDVLGSYESEWNEQQDTKDAVYPLYTAIGLDSVTVLYQLFRPSILGW